MQRILPLLPVTATLALIFSLREPGLTYVIVLLLFIFFCFIHRSYFQKTLLLLPLVFCIYLFIGEAALNKQVSQYEAGNQTIMGIIHMIPTINGDSLSMRLKSDRGELIQLQSILMSEEEQRKVRSFSPGDQCTITGTLESPSPPTNFSQFDYGRYLREQHIFWIMRPNMSRLDCQQANAFTYSLQKWRQKQIVKLEKTVEPELSGIMIALLFGDRTMMENDVIEAYQRLGVIHLLAVSGLHVGMIVAALFYLLIRLGVTRERSMDVLMLFLPLYIIIAGAAPSVIRASCMTIVVLGCLRLRTKVSPLAGIVLVYMIYLLIHPFVLFQLGFQLSFLISFGLIISAPRILNRYSHPVTQLLIVTLLCQAFSIPLLLHHVYEFSWISTPINIVYIPFVTLFVLPFSVLAFLLSFIITASINIPIVMLEMIVPYAHIGLTMLSSFKWSTLIIGKPHPFLVLCMYAVIIYACLCYEKAIRLWWLKPMCYLVIILSVQIGMPYVDSRAKVTMIDVGQGDSYLIELPYRKEVYLIDTGGTISYFDEEWRVKKREFDVGANIVVPALKELGIRRIDRLILTHGHIDHIGGADRLSQSIKIDLLLYGEGPIEGERESEIVKQIIREGAHLTFVKEGMYWNSGTSQFAILSPVGTEVDLNARSIVIYAEIEGISFLFTGDLEEEGERRLVGAYPELKVDIIKVGHHGSRTSTTELFLDHLSPKAAFISAGKNSRFGHPHPEVTERLDQHKVTVWRSDQGAVRLHIKKGEVEVKRVSR